MPVFDPNNPEGPAGAALYATATLLSGLSVFQELCETAGDQAGAFAKIALGIQKPPINAQFDLDELAAKGFEANLHWPIPSQTAIAISDSSPAPMIGGAFRLLFRRHARESEIRNFEDRVGLLLWFHDCVTACYLAVQAAAEATTCPRLRRIIPVCEGSFGEFGETSAQGEYLWAECAILWGDEVEG